MRGYLEMRKSIDAEFISEYSDTIKSIRYVHYLDIQFDPTFEWVKDVINALLHQAESIFRAAKKSETDKMQMLVFAHETQKYDCVYNNGFKKESSEYFLVKERLDSLPQLYVLPTDIKIRVLNFPT